MTQNLSNQDFQAAKKLLREILNLGIEGKGPFKGARQLAKPYLQEGALTGPQKLDAIEKLVDIETAKNFTTGFLSSMGGILSLPLAIPASLGANWAIQTRMVAAMAHIAGFDIAEPGVKAAISLCLLGDKGKEMINLNQGELLLYLKQNRLSPLSQKTLVLIQQSVASRLMKVTAQKGFTRLSKAIPVVGGILGGVLDLRSCKQSANFAMELFDFKNSLQST